MSKIVSNIKIAEGIYQMILNDPEAAKKAKPGQFLHIKIPNDDSLLLRRPISINYVENDELSIVYQVVGKGTKILGNQVNGTEIDMLEPLGNTFPDIGKNIWLVGGGVGIAPLLYITKKRPDRNYTALLGYRSKELAYQIEEFEKTCNNVHVFSNDGSIGEKGFPTQIMPDLEKPDVIMACGPKPLLKGVQKFAVENDIPCKLSLEERMGCGLGGCFACVCKIKTEDGYTHKRVCKDGPIFDAKDVIL